MKYISTIIFLGIIRFGAAQTTDRPAHEIELGYFHGNVMLHNPSISHLINRHPTGIVLSYSRKTRGDRRWHSAYNYPDYGLTFVFQDMHTSSLGQHYGLMAHYGFYFFNRHLQVKLAQGLSYNTNPYDKFRNYKNIAYGTHLLATTLLGVRYKIRNLWKNIGLQTGLMFIHYSNGSVKSPNTSTNSFTFNVGVSYTWGEVQAPIHQKNKDSLSYPIHFNILLRSGVQASDLVGSRQYPFYTFGVAAQKQISYKSSFSLGTEVFLSPMLKEHIKYRSIAYPKDGLTGDEKATRIGAFAGYHMHIGNIALLGNVGYYLYYPYDYAGRVYLRAGVQYDFLKNWFAGVSVKAHAANAESAEFTIGYQL